MPATTREHAVRARSERDDARRESEAAGSESRDGQHDSGRAEVADLLTDTDALLDEIDAVLELPEGEQVDVPPLTLSDLIREGSLLAPQAKRAWRADGATCTLTAAFDAAKARGLL